MDMLVVAVIILCIKKDFHSRSYLKAIFIKVSNPISFTLSLGETG